jgi:hypothetical protein
MSVTAQLAAKPSSRSVRLDSLELSRVYAFMVVLYLLKDSIDSSPAFDTRETQWSIAFNYLFSPLDNAIMVRMRTRTVLPLGATDVAELMTTTASVGGQDKYISDVKEISHVI